jgi:KDO2-lipid IV(A) lauroyltransferase
MLRKIRYAVEAFFICVAVVFFRILPLDVASGLAGALGRIGGPFSRAHRTARHNLERAMPELTDLQRSKILGDMWENLGRTIGEYPHLNRPIMKKRITLEGREHLERIKQSGKAAIFVSGHFANWETIALTAGLNGMPMTVLYRAANNPVAEWMIQRIRRAFTRGMYVKGRVGAVQSIRTLKEGHVLAMLVDQKQNDGIPVPFFGIPAMTSTSAIELAAKYQAPVLLAYVVRTDGAHFHVTLEPEVHYPKGADALAAMTSINAAFERVIRRHPAQWLWVHRRWG